MTSKDIYKATIKIYEELYKQATLRSNFTFRYYPAEVRLLIKFVKWMKLNYPNNLTIGLLVRYFEFQFSHYSGVITEYGKNSVMLSWLIGIKAQQRWLSRKQSEYWLIKIRMNKDNVIKIRRAFQDEEDKIKINSYRKLLLEPNAYEEKEKIRFYNSLKGFIYCQTITTLYNPNSNICNNCLYKDDCQKQLLNTLPNIYSLRCHK